MYIKCNFNVCKKDFFFDTYIFSFSNLGVQYALLQDKLSPIEFNQVFFNEEFNEQVNANEFIIYKIKVN